MDPLSFDLNLLRVFDAIYLERNVTRAAERLNLSQPAVSNALARLRERLDDPLFERTAAGMMPTARAKSIAEPIQRSLDLLREGLREQSAFDYRSSTRRFVLSVEDYGECAIFPRLLKWLFEVAPGLDITLRSGPDSQLYNEMRQGEVDMAIGYFTPGMLDFHNCRLMSDSLRTLARKDHPDIHDKLTLEAFLKLPHAALIPRTERTPIVDLALKKQGHERQIAVRVARFQAMPLILQTTRMLGTMPKRMAYLYADHFGLQAYDPPIVTPEFPIYLIWHQSTHNDLAQRWLRGVLTDLCERL